MRKMFPDSRSRERAEVSDLCRRAQKNEHFADSFYIVPAKRIAELGRQLQGFQPLIIQMRRRGNAAALTIDLFLHLELLPQIRGSRFKAVCDVVQPRRIFVQPAQRVPDNIPRPALRKVIVQANRFIADALAEMLSEHNLFTF